MHERKSKKKCLRLRSERDHHLTTIRFIVLAVYQTTPRQAIHQSYNAVVLEIETFRKLADGRVLTPRKALDGQQRLVLLGRETGRARRAYSRHQRAVAPGYRLRERAHDYRVAPEALHSDREDRAPRPSHHSRICRRSVRDLGCRCHHGQDLVFGHDDELAGHLADRMALAEIGRVPILNRKSGVLVGLVARRDLLRMRANVVQHEVEREALLRLSR